MTRPTRRRALAWGISAALLAAQCEPGPRVPEDASGVGEADICLEEQALKTLMGPEGAPLFGVTSATILDDGVVIAESSAHRLLKYSFDGELLSRLGRSGSGPGEFRSIRLVQAIGDRLMVFDQELRRITDFGQDGVVNRVVNLSVPQPFAAGRVIGFLPDGRSIGYLWTFPPPVKTGKVLRRSTVLALFDSTGVLTERLGTVPASELYAEPFGRAGERQTVVPFGKRTGSVVLDTSVAVSDGTDWAIRLINLDTGAESFLLPPGRFSPTELTPEYLAAIRERKRGLNWNTRRFLDRVTVPSSLPPYGWSGSRPVPPLVAARDGSLWAALVTAPGEGARWRVFVGGTTEIRMAASAARVELLALGGGIAITKRYDSHDVEFIELRKVQPASNCIRGGTFSALGS